MLLDHGVELPVGQKRETAEYWFRARCRSVRRATTSSRPGRGAACDSGTARRFLHRRAAFPIAVRDGHGGVVVGVVRGLGELPPLLRRVTVDPRPAAREDVGEVLEPDLARALGSDTTASGGAWRVPALSSWSSSSGPSGGPARRSPRSRCRGCRGGTRPHRARRSRCRRGGRSRRSRRRCRKYGGCSRGRAVPDLPALDLDPLRHGRAPPAVRRAGQAAPNGEPSRVAAQPISAPIASIMLCLHPSWWCRRRRRRRRQLPLRVCRT